MLKDRAILDFPSYDVDGDGNDEQGKFVLAGNLEISPEWRTGFLIGGRGSSINNVLQTAATGEGERGQGYYLDLGEGAHTIEINFRGWEGSQVPDTYDSNGKPATYKDAQWGDTGDSSTKTKTDMTGESALSQINCLEYYLSNVPVDSNNLATLAYGEYSSSGVYDPVDVVIEGPSMTKAAEDGSWFDGSMTLIEAAAFDDILSASNRGAE